MEDIDAAEVSLRVVVSYRRLCLRARSDGQPKLSVDSTFIGLGDSSRLQTRQEVRSSMFTQHKSEKPEALAIASLCFRAARKVRELVENVPSLELA